jgi:hypothetical protein
MPPAFVPFFERPSSSEILPPPSQFNQYKLSKVTVAQTTHSTRDLDKGEVRTKLLSDLRNAINLSLPEEAVDSILADLAKQRLPERMASDILDQIPSDGSVAPDGSGEKPNVRLEKDGDKITNIVVECECGQTIALDCIY